MITKTSFLHFRTKIIHSFLDLRCQLEKILIIFFSKWRNTFFSVSHEKAFYNSELEFKKITYEPFIITVYGGLPYHMSDWDWAMGSYGTLTL